MIEKAPPAGWVVQVTVATPHAPQTATSVQWIGPAVSSAPSFKYFNVATAAPAKALEATTKHLASTEGHDGPMSVVRGLSPGEISALKLEAGQVAPA